MPRLRSGPTIVLASDGIEIPPGITSLARFRAWVQRDEFPDSGRIDWVDGRLEVDMTAEDINAHSTPKSAIAGKLVSLVQEEGRGLVFIDRTRLSNRDADLSAEPDCMVLFFATLESREARLVPRRSGRPGRFREIAGRADLVVECVSDTSEDKDTRRLRDAYHAAGIPEYWLVDARRERVAFEILHRRRDGYRRAGISRDGYQRSRVLDLDVRLDRVRRVVGVEVYRLETR